MALVSILELDRAASKWMNAANVKVIYPFKRVLLINFTGFGDGGTLLDDADTTDDDDDVGTCDDDGNSSPSPSSPCCCCACCGIGLVDTGGASRLDVSTAVLAWFMIGIAAAAAAVAASLVGMVVSTTVLVGCKGLLCIVSVEL
jgi:hypothetical protein